MNIALLGYGKMGKTIESLIAEYNRDQENKIVIVLKIDKENAADLIPDNLQKADVAIEFSTPDTVVQNIYACFDAGIPVVAGTTGWYDQLAEVKDYCTKKDGTLLYSPNFSIGVNIFFELNKRLAALMAEQSDYKLSITETHHTEKLDAPSGTAIKLAEQILEKFRNKQKWVNHQTKEDNELQILSHREENVAGTHHVTYHSAVDDIEIIHTAHSRMGFASGAFKAALWLKDKKGIFTMKDVLGI